eukprot:gene1414-12034_t
MNDEIFLNHLKDIFSYTKLTELTIDYIFEALGEDEYQYLISKYGKLINFLNLNPNYFQLSHGNKVRLLEKEKKEMNVEKKMNLEDVLLEKDENVQIRTIPKIVVNNEEVRDLLNVLPKSYLQFFQNEKIDDLIDIEMDLNRIPKAHFFGKKKIQISNQVVSENDLNYITKKLKILPNNRSGIDEFLHRISVIRGISNDIVGITLRVGKPIFGISEVISDILDEKKSILFLGSPGSGKTSFIRDVARYISNDSRTIIVDSSSEISGFGNCPHSSVGDSRVMKIPENKNQEKIMIEAIQNHTPDCLIIDEIGTQMEVFATKECSQRGILLYASAHGTVKTLEKNQTVVGLVGGIESVIMGDNNISSQKEKIQRKLKYKPLFDVIIEFDKDIRNQWTIHNDVEALMENLLAGKEYEAEIRKLNLDTSSVEIKKENQNKEI